MAETAYKYDFGYEYNAATQPKKEQQTKAEPKFGVIINPFAEQVAKEREVNKLAIKVSAVLAVALVVLTAFCYSCVLLSDARHTLAATETEFYVHQTKNEELKTKLNSLVASVDIDKYAVEKLGLVKVSPENAVYLNAKADNQVVYSAKDQ